MFKNKLYIAYPNINWFLIEIVCEKEANQRFNCLVASLNKRISVQIQAHFQWTYNFSQNINNIFTK